MRKSLFKVLGATAALGAALLTTTAASAAPQARAAPATCTPVPGVDGAPSVAGSCNTTVTFTVTSGTLSITAPDTADLLSGSTTTTGAGTASVISRALGGGGVVVTDDRALLSAAWTVTASATNWTTGGGVGAELIPATDATYAPGTIRTTGTITAAPSPNLVGTPPVQAPFTLSGTAQAVVLGTAGTGNNSASWDPTIAVTLPNDAVAGVYTDTLTQSVS